MCIVMCHPNSSFHKVNMVFVIFRLVQERFDVGPHGIDLGRGGSCWCPSSVPPS